LRNTWFCLETRVYLPTRIRTKAAETTQDESGLGGKHNSDPKPKTDENLDSYGTRNKSDQRRKNDQQLKPIYDAI
jgi:hypothetical protein